MPHDPFEAIGLAPSFPVDRAAVERAWLMKSASLHPDRVGGDTAETARALALINRAKQTLLHAEAAADAYLTHLGGPGAAECKELPPELMMEMLEVREQLDTITATRDADEASALRGWAEARRTAHIREVERLLARPGESANLRAARIELNAWRYAERLLEQLGNLGF